jgi:ABC-type lipoprotein release transport system permease subunit
MGRAFLVCRLAAADVRRHPVEAALLLLAITAATTTLTLGLALHGVTSSPYQRTRAATAGPDVVASALNLTPLPKHRKHAARHQHGGEAILGNLRPSKKGLPALDALAHAPGVIGHSGPYPVAWVTLRVHGVVAGVAAVGRARADANVDQPLLTHGNWVRSGEAVVEQGYADALGIHVGDRITLNRRPFRVAGVAVTVAVPEYPNAEFAFGGDPFPHPGLIWLARADAQRLVASLPLSYILNLRLRDPATATAFVNARFNSPLSLISSQAILQKDAKLIDVEQLVLLVGSWLLGALAVASVAVLVGGRMAEQARRVGLLKAVGATPALVAAVLLFEDLALALVAAAAGLVIGWLAAPLLTSPGAGLIGSAGAPSLTASTVELVAAVAVAVAIVATFFPAVRASRLSTVRALADAARSPRRRGTLIALSTRLPVPLLLGLRLAARRPRRAILSAFSVAVTVTTIVAVATVHAHQAHQFLAGFSAIDNPRFDRVDHVLLVLSVVLVVLAAINAIFITWSTAIDGRHQLTIARALGATPIQISAGLSAAQLISAIPGAILGLPLGIELVAAVSHGTTTTVPSAWSLIAILLGTLLTIAALTAVPAWIQARRPVAQILQAELA